MHFSIKFSHISLIVWLTAWLRGSIHTIHPVVMMPFPHCKIFFPVNWALIYLCELDGPTVSSRVSSRPAVSWGSLDLGADPDTCWISSIHILLLRYSPTCCIPGGFWDSGSWACCHCVVSYETVPRLMLPLLMFDLKQPMYKSLCAKCKIMIFFKFFPLRIQWNKKGQIKYGYNLEDDVGCRVVSLIWGSGRCSVVGWNFCFSLKLLPWANPLFCWLLRCQGVFVSALCTTPIFDWTPLKTSTLSSSTTMIMIKKKSDVK